MSVSYNGIQAREATLSRRTVRDRDSSEAAGSERAAATTTGPKIEIARDAEFQPPAAAAELPSLESPRPLRRRRAEK